MQRKAQQQAADAQEDSQFMQSLSTREAELAELERAHQAALRSHNQKLKSVPLISQVLNVGIAGSTKSLVQCLLSACCCRLSTECWHSRVKEAMTCHLQLQNLVWLAKLPSKGQCKCCDDDKPS